MVIHCSQCGTNQQAPAQFCKKCGATFTAQAKPGSNTDIVKAVIGIGILLALAFMFSQK